MLAPSHTVPWSQTGVYNQYRQQQPFHMPDRLAILTHAHHDKMPALLLYPLLSIPLQQHDGEAITLNSNCRTLNVSSDLCLSSFNVYVLTNKQSKRSCSAMTFSAGEAAAWLQSLHSPRCTTSRFRPPGGRLLACCAVHRHPQPELLPPGVPLGRGLPPAAAAEVGPTAVKRCHQPLAGPHEQTRMDTKVGGLGC